MRIYSDGYTIWSNPSKIGGGYVIINGQGNILTHFKIYKVGLTNNEAELKGIICAFDLAENRDEIITDSLTAFYWIQNCKCKARKDLRDMAIKANKEMKLKNLNLIFEPRENNLAGQYIEEQHFGGKLT